MAVRPQTASASSRLLALIALCIAALIATPARAQVVDPDRDGDGLSDFQEVHKYCTDPGSADSDADGRPDGDWSERREFTYTIRSVIQVMPAYDLATLDDDYQDARVLYECPEYVELEVVHYPLNTNAASIVGAMGWRKDAAAMAEHTAATTTANYDRAMQRDILRRLAREKIDLDRLTDVEAVQRVAKWALEHAESLGKTCAWTVAFEDGEPTVPPSLRPKFDSVRGAFSDREMFDREIFGRGMYENRTRGTCTTTANYLNTVLRAVGIPTRCIVTIPVVDVSDDGNIELVKNRLRHHAVRRAIEKGVRSIRGSFAAHTYNEVWVGGRWRRLNYDRLGQNILDAGCMGLMTRVHTFSDLADANLGGGWGVGRTKPSHVFRFNNPYTTLTLSDEFGVHASIDNPASPADGHRVLTITDVYWFSDDDKRPAAIGADWHGAQDADHGHLLIHVAEDDGSGVSQYQSFLEASDATVMLRAKRRPDVRGEVIPAFWIVENGVEFYVRIAPDERAKLRKGTRYRLVAANDKADCRWDIDEDVSLEVKK